MPAFHLPALANTEETDAGKTHIENNTSKETVKTPTNTATSEAVIRPGPLSPKDRAKKQSSANTKFKPSEEISEDFSVPFPVDI